MKVAYFLGALNRGGMESLMVDVLKQAAETRKEVICVYREEGNISAQFRETGIPLFKRTPHGGLDVAYLQQLRELFKREQVKIIHAQHSLEACYAWLATRGCGIKIVQTFHGYDFHQTLKGRLFMKWMIRHADLNLFVSDVQRRYYENKYRFPAGRTRVVYNGIRFDRFDAALVAERFSSPGLLLGSVGNFVPGRDQLAICRFLSRLKQAGIPFRFLFVGRKDQRHPHLFDTCKEFCEKHDLQEEVSFLGAREDVPAILSQLDAFLYISEHDTFGIAVVEAIASGVPVLLNDWDVMREVTHEGRWATLFRSGDEEHLWSCFQDFLNHQKQYREQALQAAREVREQYAIQHHAEELYHCYSSL